MTSLYTNIILAWQAYYMAIPVFLVTLLSIAGFAIPVGMFYQLIFNKFFQL